MKPRPIKPGPGQESVWDYPRPPKLEPVHKKIKVVFNGETIAESNNACRVLETSHPPVYYIPRKDIKMEFLQKTSGESHCEWKGKAEYYNIEVRDKSAERAAFRYPEPTSGFEAIADCISFYAGMMEACYVDSEKVVPQPGGFYSGWITSDVVGPFKGIEGSMGW